MELIDRTSAARFIGATHPEMSGVLIYTAAGDSEGTMGGLVRMGEPEFLGRTIARALDRARWCSSDPVCIESTGQGPDSCNLAACHSCALLPETSCEHPMRFTPSQSPAPHPPDIPSTTQPAAGRRL